MRQVPLAHRFAFHGFVRPIRKVGAIGVRLLTVFVARLARAEDRFLQYTRRRFAALEPFPARLSKDELMTGYYAALGDRLACLRTRPKFSVLVPVYKIDPEILRETLLSVITQVYPYWELCVVDDASGDPRVGALVAELRATWGCQITFAVNAANSHISVTSNRCLELATGDYVALLDHDDRLLPNALAEMARYIDAYPATEILYSDERVIDERGAPRHGPFYKPDWSPLLHLSCNYTTHLSVYRRDLLTKVGGFRPGYEGSQDHDLMLRAVEGAATPPVHVPFVLYQWRALPGSTATSADEKPYAAIAGMKAVTEACERRGTPADVSWEKGTFHYRVSFRLPADLPLVSVIIPTRDRPELLRGCLDSLLGVTRYPHLEVLVIDNGSTCTDALAYLESVVAAHPQTVRVLRQAGPFNFGALNNLGATQARGEFLLFLNNDTVVLEANWIQEMLRLAQLPEAGAVGCKLLYPDHAIQHAGIVLIDRKIACHALRMLPENDLTYICMASTVHETSAVTAACMLLRRTKFDLVGGFDSHLLPNGFGDLDLCLKLRRAGYANVYTPYARLLHLESRSRGRTIESFEKLVMLDRWGHALMNDPYLNFNLDRSEHYALGNEASLDAPDQLLRQHWATAQRSRSGA